MHRYIFSQLKCCRSRFTTSTQILTSHPTARNFSNSKSEKNVLSQTTILVQQGCDIQELPVIMRRIDHDDMVALCSNANSVNEIMGRRVGGDTSKVNSTVDPDIVIKELKECVTQKGVLSVIDGVPEVELMPDIALVAFESLVNLGTLIDLRNLEDTNEIYGKIIDCIATKCDTQSLLDTLTSSVDLKKTSQRICDELLMRNSDGMLGIVEICVTVQKFVECHQYEGAEKFWSGLADQDKHINANNIKFIYQILPKIKVSRRMVVGVAERKITGVFWNLSSEAVVDILNALVESKQTSYRTLQSITRWLNTNIHAVSEADLESVVKCFTILEYSDGQMEKALERYIKTKGIKVKHQSLISTILTHCARFRIRNPYIMNGCSEYFIIHANDLKSEHLKSIFCPFGLLDYQPINSVKFWQTFENCLNLNFDKISARDVIDIALSCLYLEKYPINFVQRIFNPYFLDLLHTTTPLVEHPKLRSDLKLFDTGMSIECDSYNGPMLPKDHSAKGIWQDGRIKRIVQNLTDQWETISGGPDKFTKCTVMQQLPLNPLYLIDLLIHPAGMGRLWNFNTHTDRDLYIATLIHLPEHYDASKQHLIGPQSMRIRHFRRLGLKVVTLDYETVAKLRVHGNELHKYLVERMREALSATG
ncbi:FAST kinase domain-containing protein 3, mitochondrial-like [Bradysia coprophila]|uniref:FAST kinase domain-containing protein 3, mitochondrial-like n=1 Tax=Bradysia coprophila TaxID=38358 RepID=UPI00187D93A1|nr:FAST kinase domain-containing protein 3, mitochondrial-like [Bradysia coprophila]